MDSSDRLSKILKAISSPVKLRILNLLCKKEMSLNELQSPIAKEFDIKYPQTTYNYLENLVEKGLVEKIYNQNQKVIKYHIIKKKFQLNFQDLEYEFS